MSVFGIVNTFKKQWPVDPDLLCDALDISLIYTDQLPAHVTGRLVKVAKREYRIEVNSDATAMRQRFSCAHLIGHFLLNRLLLDDGLVLDNEFNSIAYDRVFNTYVTEKHRSEANQFAASLLMPKEAVQTLTDQGQSLEEMAAHLRVSRQALRIRMRAIKAA